MNPFRPLARAAHGAAFARVPAGYRFRKFGYPAWKIQSPKPERPAFTFESTNGTTEFGCSSHAGNVAAVVIDRFIEDNYAHLALPAGN